MMDDPFARAYIIMYGGATLVAALIVILDSIGRRQQRKRREKELDTDGMSIRAHRTASE